MDADVQGVYKQHNNSAGEMHQEIYIWHFNPYFLSYSDPNGLLTGYFQVNHQFRVGRIVRYNNSLMFIADYWESYTFNDLCNS